MIHLPHHRDRILLTALGIFALPGLLNAAPVKSVTLKGKEAGPTVRVIVGRVEREKAAGLDEQLAGLAIKKGQVIIETHKQGEPVEPGEMPGGKAPDLEISVLWPSDVEDKKTEETEDGEKKVITIQRPRLTSTDPEGMMPILETAIGDSLSEKSVDLIKTKAVEPKKNGAAHTVTLNFPSPRSRVSKARQFRISRRFAADLLAKQGISEPLTGVWPPNFPSSPTVCNYDAEGVGYYGSTLLERAVDETTLDVQVVSVCPEDIREGALDKAVGVFFPGGSGKGIATALKPEGVGKVKDFIAAGHGYYGVCAGAYLAASGLKEYTAMIPLVHNQPWARGKGMIKMDLTPEGVDVVGKEFANIDTRYNCGPVFLDFPGASEQDPKTPITVLARFASPATDAKGVTHQDMVGTPSVISTTYKKGRVMICSPHPESHTEFNALVARLMGWSLGIDTKSIMPRKP